MANQLTIADKSFGSRLLIGSSSYPNQQIMLGASDASGAQIVTVAMRRINVAGGGESVEIWIDRRDHQMGVEGESGMAAQGRHHPWADGQVGDEMAVHDVDVDGVGAGGLQRPHLFAEAREVRCQNRRRDAHRPLHGS